MLPELAGFVVFDDVIERDANGFLFVFRIPRELFGIPSENFFDGQFLDAFGEQLDGFLMLHRPLEIRAVADADFGLIQILAGVVSDAQIIAERERRFIRLGGGFVNHLARDALQQITDAHALGARGGAGDFPNKRLLVGRVRGVEYLHFAGLIEHPDLDRGRIDAHAFPREINFVHALLQRDDAFLLHQRGLKIGEAHHDPRAGGQGDEFDACLRGIGEHQCGGEY